MWRIPLDKEIIVVDSQRLNTYQACAKKYDHTFNKQLAPLVKAEALEEGDLMHRMLESFYKLKYHRTRWAVNGHSYEDIVAICVGIGEWHATKLDVPVEECKEVIYQFEEYCKFYEGEPHQTLAVEQVGSKILYEDDNLIILYEAKIDWVCSVGNIPVLPVDHKTSARRSETRTLSNQFMSYCWMLGVQNIMINKIGFQKTLKPSERFQRPIISYDKSRIENWRQNTVKWIFDLRESYQKDEWKLNLTSCDKYSGCIYIPICEQPTEELRRWKATALFKIEEEVWDVGAKL